ncbi:hypothetical protein AAFC00_004076 [Neodothiora populina]|uniref:Zn(2)-C6 fungal-type domain-containing protein n=1 Tax=Neodothiora populina TaxID=2781224 RepID=A0ABR3PIJ1_9PEZI
METFGQTFSAQSNAHAQMQNGPSSATGDVDVAAGPGSGPGSGKMRRPHRPRKDYTNLDTVFDSLDDLKTALRQYMDKAAATHNAAPEYISCAMTLSSHAILPLRSPLEGPYAQGGPNFLPFNALSSGRNSNNNNHDFEDPTNSDLFPTKTIQDLVDIQDLKERQIWQRAAAKGVVNAIQNLDGFKYCFNNNWTSKDDNGYRYSYTCLDSLENKDRHANGFRATNAAKRRPGANTRGVRKPTYDCKGQVAVKFSGVRRTVEVVYKHHPIHKTVAERRPPPRKDSKRKDLTDDQQLDAPADFDFDSHQDTTFLFEDDPRLHLSPSASASATSIIPLASQPLPYSIPVVNSNPPPAKKARRRIKDAVVPSQPKRQVVPEVAQPDASPAQDRPMSLAEILQQSMTGAPVVSAPPSTSQNLTPTWPGSATSPHQGPTGHYQPHPSQQSLIQMGLPQASTELRDVGRFSKLAKPCFKCKAASAECDGRQPICNSCELQGTVCNYPSILRFDKQPMESGWIQVQPTLKGRNVFRMMQQPSASLSVTQNEVPDHDPNLSVWSAHA